MSSVASNRWVVGARPRTLPAAVVPVALGAAVAVGDDAAVWWRAVLAMVVSLALQVGVNYANDYSDGVRGTDDVRVGPTRLVAGGLASPAQVKRAALVAFLVAGVCGLVLVVAVAWWLALVGVAAVAAALGYTGGPRPYGYLGLGELFVFVFFGLVATVGTTFVVIERAPSSAWLVGSMAGCLACALLVVNNLRDIPTDTVAGKRTLAVRVGDQRTRLFYVGLLIVAFALVLQTALDRPLAALGLVGVLLAVRPVRAVLGGAEGRDLIAVLADTGRVQLVTGLFTALGMALAA
jgi:1,4-dihydroxy-2-naphthoate polyprenyltransferase